MQKMSLRPAKWAIRSQVLNRIVSIASKWELYTVLNLPQENHILDKPKDVLKSAGKSILPVAGRVYSLKTPLRNMEKMQ